MARICVIGGGTAGFEAAMEAAERGAEVTVVERDEVPDPPWRSWPDFVGPRASRPVSSLASGRLGASCRVITTAALSTRSGTVTFASGAAARFKSVVHCTGSSFVPATFKGARKGGVHILDSPASYEALGRQGSESENIVIAGEGWRGMAVADRISGGGRKVTLLASGWRRGGPSPGVLEAIASAARGRGVRLVAGSVSQAIGLDRLEGIICDGAVSACETLGLIPQRIPKVIPTDVRQGATGGLVVDEHLRTSSGHAFAAGGCAEIKSAAGIPDVLDDRAGISGRVAGANCTGDGVAMAAPPSSQTTAFGLRVTRAGLGQRESRSTGFPLDSISHAWDESSACTVMFEKTTGRVTGIEMVEPEGASSQGPLPIAVGLTLESLAYGFGSSDISLLSDTARLGIGIWRRF